jgi:hypothetical protein
MLVGKQRRKKRRERVKKRYTLQHCQEQSSTPQPGHGT